MNFFQQSAATAIYRRIYFRLVSTADGESGVTGATVAGTIRKNGGAAVAQAGAVTELSDGYYYYEATAAELDTLGSILYTPSAAGAYTFSYEGMVVAYDPFPAPPTEAAIATQVRTELSTELARVDAAISTRLAAAGYTSPDNATITVIAGYVDELETRLTAARALLLDNLDAPISGLPAAGAEMALTAAERTAVATAVRDVFGVPGAVAGAGAVGAFSAAAGLSATTDLYKGALLLFLSGPLEGVSRKISGYVGGTRTFTFTGAASALDEPFPVAPANGDAFLIIGRG